MQKMKNIIFLTVILQMFLSQAVWADIGDVLFAQMTFVREIDHGAGKDYEVKISGQQENAILKSVKMNFKKRDYANFFVEEGIKEKGKTTYFIRGVSNNRAFHDGNALVALKSDRLSAIKIGFSSPNIEYKYLTKTGQVRPKKALLIMASDYSNGAAAMHFTNNGTDGTGFAFVDAKGEVTQGLLGSFKSDYAITRQEDFLMRFDDGLLWCDQREQQMENGYIQYQRCGCGIC